ncbi:MAG: M1 family metallopeptidase [Terasakiella sp.]|uniref:M1 family metallopeptidase n=1 Tax=unclassified Terasakiella TaxID=2614952 RepID=UPI003AFFFF33
MNKPLSLCVTLLTLFMISVSAQAETHLTLNVKIDLANRLLNVEGHANKAVKLPDGTQPKANEAFYYDWAFPAEHTSENWQGGAFVKGTDIYLPTKWYPQTDDFLTFDVSVTSPVTTILPGKISDEKNTAGQYSARFQMEHPSEGIPLFAGPYQITQLQQGPVTLRTYFYEGMENLSPQYLQRSAKYITRFQNQIGPFPFPQFHIIAAPIPAGYGFAGLTYMGQHILQLPFILESSLGHEILHNYWGNGVFPDYASGNWAEGLTTYMADYMTAEQTDPSKARDMRLSWLRDYNALSVDQDKPVTTFISKHGAASQVIGYHKVAFIFHMLRQTLGDQQFFAGIRHLWMSFAFKTATWADIQTSFETVTQVDLTSFFQQWTQSSGAPHFTSLSARAKRLGEEGWEIDATILQITPVFKTIVPVSIGTGDDLLQNHLTANSRLSRSKIKVLQRPNAISLDPDFNILRRLGPNETEPILRDIMLSPQVEVSLLGKIAEEPSTARQLMDRLLEGSFDISDKISLQKPFILIGEHTDIADRLQNLRLTPNDSFDITEFSARIRAAKLANGLPYLIISLKPGTGLQPLLRPLPHYGKYSELHFNGSRVIKKSTGKTQPIAVPIR